MSIFGDKGFDANSVEVENKSYSPLPKGEYDVDITNSTVKTTRAGDGQYLSVEFTISGEYNGKSYDGRKVWQNYNLINKNDKTVEIAKQQLKSLCDSIGVSTLASEDDLLGHNLTVYVIEKEDRNEVRGYKESHFKRCDDCDENSEDAETKEASEDGVDAPW